jgi:hypothetical protein
MTEKVRRAAPYAFRYPPAGTAECPPERPPAGGGYGCFSPYEFSPAGGEEGEKQRISKIREGDAPLVVVGGGAAGLELVTRLGKHLGWRRRA